MTTLARDVAIWPRMLGSQAGAAILAVGAVFFHRDGKTIGSTFYQEVGLSSAIDGSTLAQDMQLPWTANDDLKKLIASNTGKQPLSTVLDHLSAWMRATSGDVPIVWAYHHDQLAALESAYRLGAVGLSHPWYHTNTCTFQTLRHIAQRCVPGFNSKVHPGTGKTTALEDARWMAASVCEVLSALTPPPAPKPTVTPRPTPSPTTTQQPDFQDSEL